MNWLIVLAAFYENINKMVGAILYSSPNLSNSIGLG